MHRSPASEAMNLLFCTCPRNVYGFFTADPYPTGFAPFPPVIDKVPDYTGCVDDNNHASKRTKDALDKKTRADIITMNAALTNVFLNAHSSQVRGSFQQWRLHEPNIVFVDMFEWFVGHYGKMTAKDCDANRQHMAANWHPANRFDTLTLRLFTGAAYAGCTGYTMADRNIVIIGLRIIKQCSMYAKEYKAWIARESECPRIAKTFDTFKTFSAVKIMLVNQTAVPASMHGYGMAAVNNDDSVVLYDKLIENFGTAYAATHKSVKAHSSTIMSMQGQLQAMQQFCMVLQQQQPPPPTYALQQQQRGHRGSLCRNTPGGAGRGYPAPVYQQASDSGKPSAALHALQEVRQLGLLQHPWRGHPQQPHQRYVSSPRSVAQSNSDEGKHDGRFDSGPPQDDPAFCCTRACPTSAAAAMCSHHSNVATAPNSHEHHFLDGSNASDDADDASNTVSGALSRQPAVWS